MAKAKVKKATRPRRKAKEEPAISGPDPKDFAVMLIDTVETILSKRLGAGQDRLDPRPIAETVNRTLCAVRPRAAQQLDELGGYLGSIDGSVCKIDELLVKVGGGWPRDPMPEPKGGDSVAQESALSLLDDKLRQAHRLDVALVALSNRLAELV